MQRELLRALWLRITTNHTIRGRMVSSGRWLSNLILCTVVGRFCRSRRLRSVLGSTGFWSSNIPYYTLLLLLVIVSPKPSTKSEMNGIQLYSLAGSPRTLHHSIVECLLSNNIHGTTSFSNLEQKQNISCTLRSSLIWYHPVGPSCYGPGDHFVCRHGGRHHRLGKL